MAGLSDLHLVDRQPSLGAAELLARFVPPPRFDAVRFANYLPNPEHPSQRAALDAMVAFAAPVEPARRRFGRRVVAPSGPAGRYLDGGFGVGKTHLLASLWHAAPQPAAFLTFAELTAAVGFLGMPAAIEAARHFTVLCIDEFELDDVANTLLAVTFLRAVIGDTKVVATSNTLPDKLGEGRFAAEDFRREIAAIADHFEVLRMDGPDYRAAERLEAETFDEPALHRWVTGLTARGRTVSHDDFDSLVRHLRQVHPVQVPALLDGVDAVAVSGISTLTNQGDALLFVHLVDELYDAGIPVALAGCAIDELFPSSYRNGGYRKKYGRCESRLHALLGAARLG